MQRKRVPRHRVTERQNPREDTKEGVDHCSRILQERQTGPKGKEAAERAKMCGRASATTTAAGRDVIRSRVGSKGALPSDGRLGAHMGAKVAISTQGRRKQSREKQRGTAYPHRPRMIRGQINMSSSTEMQAGVSIRAQRRGLQACRVSQMSEVTRTVTRQHLKDGEKHFGRDTRSPSPSRLAAATADTTGQATSRHQKVVKVLERGTWPGATTFAFAKRGPFRRTPNLHAILKDGADDRVNDPQFCSGTEPRRQHKTMTPGCRKQEGL
jgi:hypothetical protein